MTILRMIFGILLLVLIALGGALAYLHFADLNKLRPHIEKAFSDATGRELRIAGDLQLAAGLDHDVVDLAREVGCSIEEARSVYTRLGLRVEELAGFGDGDIALVSLVTNDTSGIVDYERSGGYFSHRTSSGSGALRDLPCPAACLGPQSIGR